MRAHFTFVYDKPHPNRVVDLALAVTCASASGYTPRVHTNLTDLVRGFGVDAVPVECTPTKLWTRRKFGSYLSAPDGEPYLHLDSDVFLFKPLPLWLVNAPLFVQTDNEPKEWYGNIDAMPDAWKIRFMPAPWRAMCMGIFGGNPTLVRAYAAFAIEAAGECEGKWRGHVISEQAVLGRFVQDYCFINPPRVASLCSKLDVFPEGYRHLMSKKNDPDVRRWVEQKLWEMNPDLAAALLPGRGPTVIAPHYTQVTVGDVRRFYKDVEPRKGEQITRVQPEAVTLTSGALGLGDCVVLSDIERTAKQNGSTAWTYCGSPHWRGLMEHCPAHVDRKFSWSFDVLHEAWHNGAGSGHIIQRIQRLCGFHVHPVPQGFIVPIGAAVEKIPKRVCLHFEPSQGWSEEQSRTRHPRARKLYPRTRIELESLIDKLPPEYSFIEFGRAPVLSSPRIENGTGKPLAETIRLMAECEYLIGIDSGPMHLATALGLKVICVINFPHPNKLMLPVLVSTTVDEAWLYPQNVHLHQDADSPHIPLATRANFLRALQGDVYPYWDTDVASLLEDEIQ